MVKNKRRDDAIAKAFCEVYGVRNLLEEFGFRGIKRQGDYWMCCCPFHGEKNASFGINAEIGFFRCFRCGEAGNIYRFVKEIFAISYEDATKWIYAHSGFGDDIAVANYRLLKDISNIIDESKEQEEEDYHKVVYGDEEWEAMHESPDPYDYLSNRGYSLKTIEDFQCGYTSKWKSSAGLEERIVIPGFDENGTLIGFIGRSPCGDEPKYRYTYKFPKQHILFNLNQAKEYSDRGLILVEGSMDAMAWHNFGFPNVCAILGADLSGAQIELLRKFTDKIYLCFDSDEAGKNCTVRSVNKLHDNFELHIIKLGTYKDPGEIENRQIAEILYNKSISLDNYIVTRQYLDKL